MHGCLVPQLSPLLCDRLTAGHLFWMSQWGQNLLVLCSLDYPLFHFLLFTLVMTSAPSHHVGRAQVHVAWHAVGTQNVFAVGPSYLLCAVGVCQCRQTH